MGKSADLSLPPAKKINWAGCFVAYGNGAPMDEIALMFEVDLATLRKRAYTEKWEQLRATLPLGETLRDDKAVATLGQIKLAAIQANRDANLKAWAKLRDHAVDIIEQLQQKKLKMEKVFNGKLGIARVDDLDPTTGDMVNIATYLRTISDGSYRALGDFTAQDKPGQDGPNNGQPPAPSITIILPSVIASPRQTGPDDSKVIDLRPSDDAQPVSSTTVVEHEHERTTESLTDQLKRAKPTVETAKSVESNPQVP